MKPSSHTKGSNLGIQRQNNGGATFVAPSQHFYLIGTQLSDSFSGEELSAEIHHTFRVSSQLRSFSQAGAAALHRWPLDMPKIPARFRNSDFLFPT